MWATSKRKCGCFMLFVKTAGGNPGGKLGQKEQKEHKSAIEKTA